MEIKVASAKSLKSEIHLTILPAFHAKAQSSKSKKSEGKIQINSWPKDLREKFNHLIDSKSFHGKLGETFHFYADNGEAILGVGLGEKTKVTSEMVRKQIAKVYKSYLSKYDVVAICLDSFNLLKGHEKSARVITEALCLTHYKFDRYLDKQANQPLKTVYLITKDSGKKARITKAVNDAVAVCDSVNVARDYVHEPPNVLHSEAYAKFVEKDVKTNLKGKGVKVKVLDTAALKKEKMGLFLSVNAGSKYGARLVHLTYTPKGANSRTKHIAMVGKGLVFDTGGLSLKPGAAMVNMKFDMAGSATVYGAFRAAVLTGAKCKITCVLGITDNAITNHATYPDSIIKARNGKTVEILNTDAEGRLVLADCLDYVCDLKPHAIIDAATLTGAMLVALGKEVCGMFSNNKKLAKDLLKGAEDADEYMWQMPVVDEFREDMKGNISDYKNIGGSNFAGSAKAAAFLEFFVKDDIPWAHLDIAGVGDGQTHLPYCPAKGGSGTIVRSLHHFLMNTK